MKPRIAAESAALVVLLAATWLVVGFALREASSAAVSAGRTVFTVAGLAALVWLPGLRTAGETPRRVRWGPVVILGLTGVTAYVMLIGLPLIVYAQGSGIPWAEVATVIPLIVLIADGSNRTRRILTARRASAERQAA